MLNRNLKQTSLNEIFTYTPRYEEEENYDYMGGCSNGHGQIYHFTELVWKSSTKVGVGIAQRGYRTVVVARYIPGGNAWGQFSQNVMARIPGGSIL